MVFPLLAIRRRKILLALAVLLVLLVGPYLFSRVMSPYRRVRLRENTTVVQQATTAAETLRVLTYNIAHGRGPTATSNWQGSTAEKRERIEDIAELLIEADADVVVLNEVDFSASWSGHQNQAAAIAQAAGYPYWVEQRNLDFRFLYGSWKFGNAILSRYPIVAAEPLKLPPRAQWEHALAGSKQSVIATIELPGGRQLRVAAIHLESRGETNRVQCVPALLAAVNASDIPLLLAGDFNSTPSGFPLSRQSETGENALELLLASQAFTAHSSTPLADAELTFRAYEPINLIDWILIPADWQFAEYRVLDTTLSDHRPVVADVVMT